MPRPAKKNCVAALDIGSSKIACFIAETNSEGGLNITGIGHQFSQGIRNGTITDIRQAEASIRAAVAAAEHMAGVNIDRVFVSISGCRQKSHNISVQMPIGGHEVSERDIYRVISQGCQQLADDNNEAIHCIPLEYAIDKITGISDPVGMSGMMLTVVMHVVTASSSSLVNIANCLAKCHLDIEDYIISPYASAISCLSEDEKRLGCILLDFGSSQTSIAIFKNGNMLHSANVPIGGMHITNDIALGLATTAQHAERAKNLYGNLFASARHDREIIDILQIGDNGLPETGQVQKAGLVNIIRPRVEEIIEMVADKIKLSGYENMGGNIVITGGAAKLTGLKENVAENFGKQVRHGYPPAIDGMAESTKGPAFAVCAGILLFGLEKRNNSSYSLGAMAKFNNPVHRIISWFRENF